MIPIAEPSPILMSNLRAIKSVDAELAERLCWPVDGSHVELQPDGTASYRQHLTRLPLNMPEAALAEILREAPFTPERPEAEDAAGMDIFVFGTGLGEQLSLLLDRHKKARIVAWERDPWLLRLALSRRDYGPALRSRRLRLSLGVGLLDHLPALHGRARAKVMRHPLLGRLYTNEAHLLDEGLRERRALVVSGGLLVDDLERSLRGLGHSLFTLEVTRLSMEEISHTVERFSPAFIAAINYTHGLAEFCEEKRVPLLVWEVDLATDNLRTLPLRPERTRVFTYRQAHVAKYQAAGFPHVEYLPLAADPRKRTRLPEEAFRDYLCQLSFVGSSGADKLPAHRRRFLESYARFHGDAGEARQRGEALIEEVLAEQRRDLSRYIIPELLLARCPDFYRYTLSASDECDAARLLGELVSCEKRLSYLAALRDLDVRVYGDEGFRQIEGGGLRYMGLAGHQVELTRIYCGSQINLDINRLFQPDIVTMRIFEILCCEGFVLCEHSDALSELFQAGVDLEVYRSKGELLDKVRYYLAHPARARDIARHGMQTVHRLHTVDARVRRMLATLPTPP